MTDEGKVEWAKNVHAGYLDQHAVLEKGMSIGQVLKSAFDPLLKKEDIFSAMQYAPHPDSW